MFPNSIMFCADSTMTGTCKELLMVRLQTKNYHGLNNRDVEEATFKVGATNGSTKVNSPLRGNRGGKYTQRCLCDTPLPPLH